MVIPYLAFAHNLDEPDATFNQPPGNQAPAVDRTGRLVPPGTKSDSWRQFREPSDDDRCRVDAFANLVIT